MLFDSLGDAIMYVDNQRLQMFCSICFRCFLNMVVALNLLAKNSLFGCIYVYEYC